MSSSVIAEPRPYPGAHQPIWTRIYHAAGNLGMVFMCHLALLGIPFVETSSWTFLQLYIGSQVVSLTLTLVLHRYFAHHTFKTSRWFQFVLAVYSCHALQGGLLWWTLNHRLHHKHSDGPDDPHSPAIHGMWYGYLAWLFTDVRHADRSMIRDLTKFRELELLERVWWLPPMITAGAIYYFLGFSGLIYGYCIPVVLLFHFVCCINTIGHRYGPQRFDTGDGSRNNFFLGILSMGDGWHNNHHRAPYAARQGFAWYEFDMIYGIIRTMGAVGLVWNIRQPAEDVLAEARGERKVLPRKIPEKQTV
jgi:stearoyl-CoA desaturase (delta-9 desaturase)